MLRPAKLLPLILLAACGPSEGQAQGDTPSPSEQAGPGSHASATDQERLPPPKHAWVIFGADTVLAELARTPEERSQGLMYRENLPKGHGMFFVFTDSQVRSFWMSNTFIPLDIAYMDAELKIVDIQAMEPQTTEGHASAFPTMFALEVPQGWFAEMGIGVGARAKVVFGPG